MPPKKPMNVDPAELRAQAVKLNKAGDDLNTKLTTAISALNALGNFWGDDGYGTTFYNGDHGKPGYHVEHDNVSTDTKAIISGYHGIADRLGQMADHVDVANWNSIVTLPQIPK
ncbi:MAG: hypothetical protein JWN00_2515 [Actinomycetia bacterium]|jgi:hypothetical protein|nr:hypothetical protein [Actinomycetes bacterium]